MDSALDDVEIGVVLVRVLEHYVDDHLEGSRSGLVASIPMLLPGTGWLSKRVVAKLVEVNRHVKDKGCSWGADDQFSA